MVKVSAMVRVNGHLHIRIVSELLFLEEQNYFFWKVLEKNQRIDMKPEDS